MGLYSGAMVKFNEFVEQTVKTRQGHAGVCSGARLQPHDLEGVCDEVCLQATRMRCGAKERSRMVHWSSKGLREEGVLALRRVRRQVQVQLGRRRRRLEGPGQTVPARRFLVVPRAEGHKTLCARACAPDDVQMNQLVCLKLIAAISGCKLPLQERRRDWWTWLRRATRRST